DLTVEAVEGSHASPAALLHGLAAVGVRQRCLQHGAQAPGEVGRRSRRENYGCHALNGRPQAATGLALRYASISRISSGFKRNSADRTTCRACSAERMPTIAPVTTGSRRVQAIATSPGVQLWRSAMLRSTSTSPRLRLRSGSWKLGVLGRKSSRGS